MKRSALTRTRRAATSTSNSKSPAAERMPLAVALSACLRWQRALPTKIEMRRAWPGLARRIATSLGWLAALGVALGASLPALAGPVAPPPAGAASGAPPAPIVGKLRVLVVPAYWSDYTGEEPASIARISELI